MALRYLPILPFRSHYQSLTPRLSPPVAGVSALPPGQLKDRLQPLGPFSGDRGLKEPRRDPPPSSPASQFSMGGTALPLKSRRHSDADKPKGKRPCKTKHTSLRDREKKKDGALSSPGQHCSVELGAPEEDKVRGPPTGARPWLGPSGCCSQRILRMLVSSSDYAAGKKGVGAEGCRLEGGGVERGGGGGSMFTMFRGLLEL